jgi:hypothetical protein
MSYGGHRIAVRSIHQITLHQPASCFNLYGCDHPRRHCKATPVDADEFPQDSISGVLKITFLALCFRARLDLVYRPLSVPLAYGIRQTIQTGLKDANGYALLQRHAN